MAILGSGSATGRPTVPAMSEVTSGRLVFKIGEAFPADNPVAVFLVSLSTALNDLLFTNRRLVGGDDTEPGLHEVGAAEHQFLLRSSISHVWELRESIRHARKNGDVDAFIDTLPEGARNALATIQNPNTNEAHWITAAMEHIRNQANHYGGKWNWDDLEWAMTKLADTDGTIEMTSPKLAGMRLAFADEIAVQHLTRKFPDYAEDPDAEVDDETILARIHTLFIAVRDVTSAAITFTQLAVDAYLDTLPEGVVRPEADSS